MPALLLLLCLLADPAPKSRLVVLDLKGRGVNADLVASINDVLLASVRAAASGSDVLGTSEVGTLLGVERQKQKLGCDTNDASCLAEIGGALGAERLVVTTLDTVGSSYFLDLKLMDLRHARVIGESSATLPHDDDGLLKAIATATAQVFAPRAAPSSGPTAAAAAPSIVASVATPESSQAPAVVPAAVPAAAPSGEPAANPAPDLKGWSTRHPEAARDLGVWVKAHSKPAGLLFEMDRRAPLRVKDLISWATVHPEEQIDVFTAAHPDWKMGEALQKRGASTTSFLHWVRRHPEAATDLMTHPRGLYWTGTHLFAGEWQSSAPHSAADGGVE